MRTLNEYIISSNLFEIIVILIHLKLSLHNIPCVQSIKETFQIGNDDEEGSMKQIHEINIKKRNGRARR